MLQHVAHSNTRGARKGRLSRVSRDSVCSCTNLGGQLLLASACDHPSHRGKRPYLSLFGGCESITPVALEIREARVLAQIQEQNNLYNNAKNRLNQLKQREAIIEGSPNSPQGMLTASK